MLQILQNSSKILKKNQKHCEDQYFAEWELGRWEENWTN